MVTPQGQSAGWGTSRRFALCALALYIAYAVLQTWPLATDPTGLLAGASVSPDFGGTAAQTGYLLQHHLTPFLPAVLHGIDAPEGLRLNWVVSWIGAPSTAIYYGLSLAFGEVGGANAFLWLSFVASAMAMFLLCRRLFDHGGVALFAGLAFGFSPFAVQQIGAHPVYAQGWVLVAAVWRMLELIDTPRPRNALWAGVAIASAMWFTPYFILFGGLAAVMLFGLALIVARSRHEVRRTVGLWTLAAVPVLALFSGLGVLVANSGGADAGGLQNHGIYEFYAFSARPFQWLLPDRRNPVFGGLTGAYLTHHLNGSNFAEASLYLGISVIGLALIGGWWAARRLRADRGRALQDPRVLAVLAGWLLALVAAGFSLPPAIGVGSLHIATPEAFVYLITSTWRTTSRLVEVIELGLCLASAAGVSRLLAGRGRRTSMVLVAGLVCVVGLDLWARPMTRAVSVSPPPEYVWLDHHPGGIVADYPLRIAAADHYEQLFWADTDHHPSFSGYPGGVDEAVKTGLADLRDPTTAAELAALRVRYVVTHPGQPGSDPSAMDRRGYTLRFASAHGDVYAVTAPPARSRVDVIEAVDPIQGPPGAEYRWLNGPSEIQVSARGCGTCTATVDFRSRSDKLARVLTVTAPTGMRLARVRIPVARLVTVRIADVRLRRGTATLSLTTDRPPSNPPRKSTLLSAVSVTVQTPRVAITAR